MKEERNLPKSRAVKDIDNGIKISDYFGCETKIGLVIARKLPEAALVDPVKYLQMIMMKHPHRYATLRRMIAFPPKLELVRTNLEFGDIGMFERVMEGACNVHT